MRIVFLFKALQPLCAIGVYDLICFVAKRKVDIALIPDQQRAWAVGRMLDLRSICQKAVRTPPELTNLGPKCLSNRVEISVSVPWNGYAVETHVAIGEAR